MKYLPLKSNQIGNLSTEAVVRLCVNDVPQGGIKLDLIRARLRVVDALERANGGLLSLEDADAAVLQSAAKGMSWARVSPQIVEFCDAIDNMPSQLPLSTPDNPMEMT